VGTLPHKGQNNATEAIKAPIRRVFKKKADFEKNVSTGWFWVVGFGGKLRGRRESVQKLMVLQTFPPNPFLLCFLGALRYFCL
jgi:hypothetical protein